MQTLRTEKNALSHPRLRKPLLQSIGIAFDFSPQGKGMDLACANTHRQGAGAGTRQIHTILFQLRPKFQETDSSSNFLVRLPPGATRCLCSPSPTTTSSTTPSSIGTSERVRPFSWESWHEAKTEPVASTFRMPRAHFVVVSYQDLTWKPKQINRPAGSHARRR